ncbi:nicotinate (nicotinamide) nucleotide adenylyltransferase [Patescibacteria group bacterium]
MSSFQESRIKKIGILGSSFDPPHFGHLLVARQTREVVGLDEVWMMPYFAHSWDDSIAPPSDRLEMVRLIEESGIIASDEEIKHKKKSYTVETIKRLKKKHDHDFYFIVGSDIMPEFNQWKQPDELIKLVNFLIFPRNGYPLPENLPNGFEVVSSSELVTSNLSSTIVRNRFKKGLSVVGLIPEKVLAYIDKHNLYGKDKP